MWLISLDFFLIFICWIFVLGYGPRNSLVLCLLLSIISLGFQGFNPVSSCSSLFFGKHCMEALNMYVKGKYTWNWTGHSIFFPILYVFTPYLALCPHSTWNQQYWQNTNYILDNESSILNNNNNKVIHMILPIFRMVLHNMPAKLMLASACVVSGLSKQKYGKWPNAQFMLFGYW